MNQTPETVDGLYWDIWIRLFHWSLALAVGFQLLSGLSGFEFIDWHGRIGEVVLMLVVFRVLWSVVGGPNTGLHGLVAAPAAVLRHARHLLQRNVPIERGHNAAGGWAVLAMLAIVGVQAVTGLFIADEEELLEGALYSDVGRGTSDLLWRIHMINADLLKAIVILHVAMIAVYGIWARRDLLTPMILGRHRRATTRATGDMSTSEGIPSPSQAPVMTLVRGAVCVVLSVLGVGWLTGWF